MGCRAGGGNACSVCVFVCLCLDVCVCDTCMLPPCALCLCVCVFVFLCVCVCNTCMLPALGGNLCSVCVFVCAHACLVGTGMENLALFVYCLCMHVMRMRVLLAVKRKNVP